jgi:hypothetical protein
MRRITKTLVFIAIVIGLFFGAAVTETWVRRTQVAELAIAGVPIEGVNISGAYMPDFLWQGRVWWINIDTDKPLVLTLDGWSGQIPVGVHKVYSNHDHTNTGTYGDRQFWGFPQTVSVREATP